MARLKNRNTAVAAAAAPVAPVARPSLSELMATGQKQASLDVWKDRAFAFCKEFADESIPPSVDMCKKGGTYYYAFQAWEKVHYPKPEAPAFPA